MIKQVLSTSGNVSIKLAKKLFESKIEPILTYGRIIWGVEKSTNTVTLNGLEYDDTLRSIRKFIQTFFSTLWNGYCPELDLVKRLRRNLIKTPQSSLDFHIFKIKKSFSTIQEIYRKVFSYVIITKQIVVRKFIRCRTNFLNTALG